MAYKQTLFDREGPDAGVSLKALGHGLMVAGLSVPLFAVANLKHAVPLTGFAAVAWIVGCSAAAGAAAALLGLGVSYTAARGWTRFTMGGSTTPYKNQYSYQQALVMQGRVDEALASFEAIVGEDPLAIDARVKAAELYIRERQNHTRAAELFREIQREPTVAIGEDVYATRRLVDLLTGPLGEPGRAQVELRRLIERYPGTTAAAQARETLAALKRPSVESP